MKKTLLIAAAFGGLTFGGTAIAQDQMRGGDVTRADVENRTTERFARMDANGDGVFNAEDREARSRARFDEADANSDGALTYEEMEAARDERRAQREERRAERTERRAERGEQRAGRGERRGGQRMGRRGGGGDRMAMMQQADTNGDGGISLEEMTTAALARFDAADANGDGTLTAEERRAQRGEGRGRRGGGRQG